MATTRRALVIGGSMSGLLTAVMLLRRGWEVDVFERAEDELAGRGAGIVAQPELIARLDALGIDTKDLGVAVTTRKIFDRDGRVTATSTCPQMLTAWERVFRLLRDAFPQEHYHRAHGLKAFEQTPEGVTPTSSTAAGAGRCAGRRRRFALDGAAAMPAECRAALCRLCGVARSIVRKRFPARDSPRILHADELLPAAGRAMARLSGGRAQQRLREGQRRYNVVWYRPADEARELPQLLTDRTAWRIRSRSRRRSFAPSRSPPCALRPNGCWRRNRARSFA